MLEMFRKWFRTPEPVPVVPQIVVRAAGYAGVARGLGPGMLDMETTMAAAGAQARHEGITDPDVIRKRKIRARQALNGARAEAMRTGEPVSFKIGKQTFTVTP